MVSVIEAQHIWESFLAFQLAVIAYDGNQSVRESKHLQLSLCRELGRYANLFWDTCNVRYTYSEFLTDSVH